MVSPTKHAIAGPGVWCKDKLLLHTSLVWDSVGLKAHVPRSWVRYAVLPTKTSLLFIQFRGSTPSFLSAGSQVFTTRLVNLSFHFILVAFILSSVSLLLMTWSHRLLTLLLLWGVSCIIPSHCSTQMRYTDLERGICRRQVRPWCIVLLISC